MSFMVKQPDGELKIIDLKNDRFTQKSALIHELGHCIVALRLGYNAEIIFNPEERVAVCRTSPIRTFTEIKGLENQATIGLGGMVAEEIAGVSTGGFLADQKGVFDLMKRIYELKGVDFPYKTVFEMPFNVYGPKYKLCEQILRAQKGDDSLENLAEGLLQKMEQ